MSTKQLDLTPVERWFLTIPHKKTQDEYLKHFRPFLEYAGMTAEELIKERDENLKSDKEIVRRRAEERLLRWFQILEKEGKARNTCVLSFSTIKSFYKNNYMKLKTKTPRTWCMSSPYPVTRKNLGSLINAARRSLHKAYILCQSQSGLSVSDLLMVKRSAIHNIETDYIHLRLFRSKRRELGYFDTFFGKMASEALIEHLKGDLKGASKDLIFVCSLRNINDFLSRISIRAGLDWKVSRHDLRKYFTTNMKLAGLNESLVEYWIGHSLGRTRGAYMVPPVEEQLKVYKQVEERLEPSWDDN